MNNKGAEQTGLMRRLVCAFIVPKPPKTGFLATRPICKTTLAGKELKAEIKFEPVHEISNNVVCATKKASDQPAHMRSLIRAFACRLNIL